MSSMQIECVILKVLSMDLNDRYEAGIYASMEKSKSMVFIEVHVNPTCMSKLVRM